MTICPASSARNHPAGGVRVAVRPAAGEPGRGGRTQLIHPPGNPGRFTEAVGSTALHAIETPWPRRFVPLSRGCRSCSYGKSM